MKPLHLNNDDPWMLGENIPNCDLFFSTIWLNGFVSFFDRHVGRAYNKILCEYRGYNLWFYFGEKDSNEVGELISDRIINEPGYAAEVNKNIIIESDKLRAFCETIPQENLDKLSNDELWHFYKKHNDVHSEYYTWGWIPVAADMFHNNLTTKVKAYLAEIGVPTNLCNTHLVTLTQPTEKSLIAIEQEELLKIAQKIEQDNELVEMFKKNDPKDITTKLPEELKNMLEAHRKKYFYTKHLWVSGEYSVQDYIGQLKEIVSSDISATTSLQKIEKEIEETKGERAKLMDEFEISEEWRTVLDEYGNFMVTKIYRRYAQLLAVHHMSAILKEMARRNNITEMQVRFMRPQEIEGMLKGESVDEAELLKRTEHCIYYAEKGHEGIFIEKKAEEISKTLEREIDTDVTELRGETGCVGCATGKVKIIIRASDMDKMEEGDILVSIATDPDIVPAMKKAAAIVTEQGGVTSHAAIVARELNIPCVIGTKIATKVLKDGMRVMVDATQGIVTIEE